jgi:biotin carboxylase
MKKLLILNGSHSDIPLILAAKNLGFYVITTGLIDNLPGHKFSHEYHKEDFSDKDAILNLATNLKIDGICSCANDFGALTAAYVAESLELPGHDSYEVALTLHHKDRFKEFANNNNVTTPSALSFSDISEAIESAAKYTFPLIVKPVDLTGGKGVTKVESKKNLKNAIIHAFEKSQKKRIVIENFIEGSLHSLTTFILKKKVVFTFSDNEYTYIDPFLITTSAAPAFNFESVKQFLIDEIESIASKLNVVDGIFHIQYIQLGNHVEIIEATRRCSGDFYPYPVKYSTGLDWAEWIVKAEAGIDCSNFPIAKQKGFFGRHCVMSNKNGIIDDMIICDQIKPNIINEFRMWKKGDKVTNFSKEKFSVIFLKYESYDEMIFKTKNITNFISMVIQN